MRTIMPLVFRIGTRIDVFSNIPSHICEKKLQVISLLIINLRFVQQQEQVPVTTFMVIATGTRTIKIESATFGQNFLCHLLDVIDNLRMFHILFVLLLQITEK